VVSALIDIWCLFSAAEPASDRCVGTAPSRAAITPTGDTQLVGFRLVHALVDGDLNASLMVVEDH